MRYYVLFILFLITDCFAVGVKSNQGDIQFDVNADELVEMTLSETGLGIGKVPVSSLDVQGTMGMSMSVVTSDANMTDLNSSVVVVGDSNENVVLTLPEATNVAGRMYTVKHNNGSVRSTLTSSSNIDGQRYLALNPIANSRLYPSVTVISDGATWNVLNAHRQELSDIVASDNLVVWWTFDDEPTTTYIDHSLNGNDGVIGGSADYSQIDGKAGRGILGNTRQTMLTVANNSTIGLSSISAGFWIKGADADEASWGNYSPILSKININNNGWQVDFNQSSASPRLIRTRTDVSSSDRNNVTTNIDVFDGTWHFITYTMADDTASFYVDGALSSTRSLSTGAGNTLSNTASLSLFTDVNISIDEVRIYDRELSADEVSQWYTE